MMSACNEFRQEEKDWLAPKSRFDKWGNNQGLYVDGEDDDLKGKNLTTNKNVPRVNDIDDDTAEAKAELRKIMFASSNTFTADAEAYNSDDDHSEEEGEKWDCESILSTYTNTDNHPGVIKTSKRIRPGKVKIDLHKQFRVPIDGLTPIAEEILIKKKERDAPKDQPFMLREDSDSDDFEIEETAETEAKIANPRKALKAEKKTEMRAKRALKKDLK